MNKEEFEIGYKHLKRFLKNEGYFNTFKKYTAHNNEEEYKEKALKIIDRHTEKKGGRMNDKN